MDGQFQMFDVSVNVALPDHALVKLHSRNTTAERHPLKGSHGR